MEYMFMGQCKNLHLLARGGEKVHSGDRLPLSTYSHGGEFKLLPRQIKSPGTSIT